MLDELKRILGSRLSTDPEVCERHGKDASFHPISAPDMVAFPESTVEVAAIVAACARARVPFVAFGAGTSLEGHVSAPLGGVCIDLGRMNRVLALHADDQDAVVQAGVTREILDARASEHGLFFPVDPGAAATFGGMASTRASGTNAVRYGTMRDNVLGLEVVLPDGNVIHTGGRARKSSAGYDLTRLFIGAEGTLGVITELTLRLAPQPEAIATAVCSFATLEGAIETVTRTLRTGITPARIELLDERMIEAVNRHSGLDHTLAPSLFLEFHGGREGVAEQVRAVAALAAANGGSGFREATDPAARAKLWRARHDAYWAAIALRPGAHALTTDVCVPISALARCILDTRQDLANLSFPAPLLGHVGDGNFHVLLLVDPGSKDERAAADAVVKRLVERALAAGGTCTGEHGIGLGKREFLTAEHGASVRTMRAIKAALDPHDLANPGKLFL